MGKLKNSCLCGWFNNARLSRDILAGIPGISSAECRKMALVCGPILFNHEADRFVEKKHNKQHIDET
jgi:hypothetical protein